MTFEVKFHNKQILHLSNVNIHIKKKIRLQNVSIHINFRQIDS